MLHDLIPANSIFWNICIHVYVIISILILAIRSYYKDSENSQNKSYLA